MASNQTLPVLRRGSTGEAVRRLQRSLVIGELLPNTGIDGIFGPATEQAVRNFQKDVGIGVDGIVGAATRFDGGRCPGPAAGARGDRPGVGGGEPGPRRR